MDELAQNNPELFTLIIVSIFPIFWCSICYIISRLSGWSKIAAEYPRMQDPFSGNRFRFRSMRLGLANYNNCVSFTVAPQGLFISVMPFFRVGHPPVMIPWSIFSNVEEKSVVFFSWYEFSLSHPHVTLKLPRSVAEDALQLGYIRS